MTMTIGPSAFDEPQRCDLVTHDNTAGGAAERPLALADIQGNVIPGFKKPLQTLLYFHIHDADSFKPAVAALGDLVAKGSDVLTFNRLRNAKRKRGEPLDTLRKTWVNVAFSSAGLAKLTNDVDQFADASFRDGLVRRSRVLGDPQSTPGDLRGWTIRDGDSTEAADMLVIVAADEPADLEDDTENLENKVQEVVDLVLHRGGATPCGRDDGQVLGGREHFGFRDNISKPGIRGLITQNPVDFLTARSNPADPDHGNPGQELVWPGEFIFGYPDQDGSRESGTSDWMKDGAGFPRAPAWARNGSFLVFRRLRQNVHLFHRFLHTNRGTGTAAALGARIVGRWPSGAPVERTPERDDPTLADDNEFDFPQPPKKSFCPGDAHIRKVNPRSDLSPDELLRHRMLRRAIPFGVASASTIDKPDDDGVERGLLFLAYMTSIVDQFEFVTTAWANNPDFRSRGAGTDALLRRSSEEWIVPTGGGYYFSPSITALKKVLSA
jgi:Dyp-type peroxidase family